MRDNETVAAAVEAGQTGHAVYATAHTTGVAATVRRMMSLFDKSERTERGFAMMETMRMIVTQALVPKIGGGRVSVREWMIFTDDVREKLLNSNDEQWSMEISRMLPANGQSMSVSAQTAFDAGLIDKRQYILLSKSTGHEE